MSMKRQQHEEGNSMDDERPRKSPSFKSVVLDVMSLQRLQNLVEPVLEPLIRRVVKEEVDIALRKYIINMKRNCGKDIQPSASRRLQLEFLNGLSLPVFTGTHIEGEGASNLQVALVDTLTGEVVSSGPGSSAKVEIVALEGDFEGEDGKDWTLEEFRNNIVKERRGKKPLLTGDVLLTLKDGTGLVGNIMFTDNSSWTRSRKFILGARLLENIGGMRVREARSEPFVVRDHRGELYKKHYPPYLSDEVWRLEKIGKDGAFHKRLSKEKVKTVKDFLILLFLDPTRLRNILGTGMSSKMWEAMVEHAQTCVLDKKLYLYDASGSEQKNGVVFNVVGQVMGMRSHGDYVLNDKLSDAEKDEARELVNYAFRNRQKIVTFNDESFMTMPSSLSCFPEAQFSEFPSKDDHLDQNSHDKPGRFNYTQEDASSPNFMQSVYSIGDMSSRIDDYLHGIDPFDVRYDQTFDFPGHIAPDDLICDTDSMTRAFCASESLELSTDLRSGMDPYIPCAVVPVDEAYRKWSILLSVFRWCFSIRRIMARKTRVGKKPKCLPYLARRARGFRRQV